MIFSNNHAIKSDFDHPKVTYCFESSKQSLTVPGECGGVMIEHRTLNREFLGWIPTCVTMYPWARHINFPEYWLIYRKQWLHHDMTEKLLTGTLNLKTNTNVPEQAFHRQITSNWCIIHEPLIMLQYEID